MSSADQTGGRRARATSKSAGRKDEPVPVSELSYTEASGELDAIVAFFEEREVDVDQLVARLERATTIVDELDRRLRQTRMHVEELVPRLEAAAREVSTPAAGAEAAADEAGQDQAGQKETGQGESVESFDDDLEVWAEHDDDGYERGLRSDRPLF